MKKIRNVVWMLVLALVVSNVAVVAPARAAVTESGIVYDGNGSCSKTLQNGKNASVSVENSIISITVDGEKYAFYNTVTVASCVIAEDDLLHIFWHTGDYFVYDLYENACYIVAYKNTEGKYCKQEETGAYAVKGTSAANSSFHTCIIDNQYFFEYGKAGKKRLMTREEFERIAYDKVEDEPTAAPTVAPTAEPTPTPDLSVNNTNDNDASGENNGENNADVDVNGDGNSVSTDQHIDQYIEQNITNNNITINGNDNTVGAGGENGGNVGTPGTVAVKQVPTYKIKTTGKTFVMSPKESRIVPYTATKNGSAVKVVATSTSKYLKAAVSSANKLKLTLKKGAKDAAKYKVVLKNGTITSTLTVVVYKHRVVTSGKRIKLFKKTNKLYGWLLFNNKTGKLNWNGLHMKNIKAAGFIEDSWRIGVITKKGTVKSISYKSGKVKTIAKKGKSFRRNSRGCIISYVKKSNNKVVSIKGR